MSSSPTLAPDPEALHASFAVYRALDTTMAQNQQRKTRRLTLPVLAIGGAEGSGEGAGNTMKLAADDGQSLVIPGCGHWVAEEAPEEMVAALTAFLAPYHTARPRRTTPRAHAAGTSCRPGRDPGQCEALTSRIRWISPLPVTYCEELFGHAVEINSHSYEQSHPSRTRRS